jgi:Domain of unknown function (DUF4330)
MLKKLNWIDATVFGIIGLGVVGVMLVQSGSLKTSGAMVEGESDIQVTVGVFGAEIKDKDILKAGDKTSLTVRNQPRGEVAIEAVRWTRPRITLMGPGGKAVTVDSVVHPDVYDIYVTLKDHALVSKEGFVTNGVKVKVGQPIEVEGFAYRLTGKIIDVKALTPPAETNVDAKAAS